jgi:hypothetical protein
MRVAWLSRSRPSQLDHKLEAKGRGDTTKRPEARGASSALETCNRGLRAADPGR